MLATELAAIAKEGDVVFIEQTQPSSPRMRYAWAEIFAEAKEMIGVDMVLLPYGTRVARIEHALEDVEDGSHV